MKFEEQTDVELMGHFAAKGSSDNNMKLRPVLIIHFPENQ